MRRSRNNSCRSAISSSPISKRGWRARITGSAHAICRPTSTNSRFGSTGAYTRSTPSARCSASQATPRRRPTPSFTPGTGPTLHLAGVCVNRIGIQLTSPRGSRGSRRKREELSLRSESRKQARRLPRGLIRIRCLRVAGITAEKAASAGTCDPWARGGQCRIGREPWKTALRPSLPTFSNPLSHEGVWCPPAHRPFWNRACPGFRAGF